MPAKLLKVAETAKGAYKISKISKRWKPLFRIFNKIKKYKISSKAPKGYKTGGQIISKIVKLDKPIRFVLMTPKLYQALGKVHYVDVVTDLADVLGIDGCVDAIKLGLS